MAAYQAPGVLMNNFCVEDGWFLHRKSLYDAHRDMVTSVVQCLLTSWGKIGKIRDERCDLTFDGIPAEPSKLRSVTHGILHGNPLPVDPKPSALLAAEGFGVYGWIVIVSTIYLFHHTLERLLLVAKGASLHGPFPLVREAVLACVT